MIGNRSYVNLSDALSKNGAVLKAHKVSLVLVKMILDTERDAMRWRCKQVF